MAATTASIGNFHLGGGRMASASMSGSGTETDFEDEGTSILRPSNNTNRRRLDSGGGGKPPRVPILGSKVAAADMEKKMPAHHGPPPHAFPRRLSNGTGTNMAPGLLLGDNMELPPPAGEGEGSGLPSLTRESTFNSCARPDHSSLTRDSTFGSIPRPDHASLISDSTFGSARLEDGGSLTRESTFNSNDSSAMGDKKMPAFPNEAVAQMEAVIRRQFRRNSADTSSVLGVDQNFQEEAPSAFAGNRLRTGSSASLKSVERFVRPNRKGGSGGDQEIRESSIHRRSDHGRDPYHASVESDGLRSYISSSLRPLANAVRRLSGDSLSSGAKVFPGGASSRKDEIHRLRPTTRGEDFDDLDARAMDECIEQMNRTTSVSFDHAPQTQEPDREESLVLPTDARDFRDFQRQQEEAFAELERQKIRRAEQQATTHRQQEQAQSTRRPQGEASSSLSSTNERSPMALACRVFPIREAETSSETDASDTLYSRSYSPPSVVGSQQVVSASGFVVAQRIDPSGGGDYYSDAKVVAASGNNSCRPWRNLLLVVVAFLLVVMGVVLGTVLTTSQQTVVSDPVGTSNHNSTAFRYPRTRAPHPNPKEEALRFIVDTVSNPKAIDERGSPQYLAFKWLSERDHYFHNVGIYDRDWTTLPASKVTQRYVLAVLFYSTGGRHYWSKDLSFLTEKDECEWIEELEQQSAHEHPDGVLCDDSNLIVGIELEANLTGTIPSEMGALQSMMVLELAENNLHGTITDRLGDLDQLLYLSLEGNDLRGTVPETIGNLKNLQHLVLAENRLSGAVPNSLSRLTKLEQLRLESNELYGDLGPIFCVTPDASPGDFWSDCYSEKPDFSDAEIKCSCCSACCDSASDACYATRKNGD